MQPSSYIIPIGLGNLLIGQYHLPFICRDSDPQLERESRIRSGNYFETVATELENLADLVDDKLIQYDIERIVEELLYVQRRYQVVKRSMNNQKD